MQRFDAEPREVLRAELAAAMVTFIEKNHLVAGVELGHQQSHNGGHSAGKQDGHFAPFKRRQLPLGDALAGVAVSAILFARLFFFDEIDNCLRVLERVR